MAQEYKNLLFTLLWHDLVERLDTLILEIRHLQINIIHELSEPSLYEILHKEEGVLWIGDGNMNKWDELELDKDSIKRFINAHMRSYETLNIEEYQKANKKYGLWGRDQRRFYYSLITLQELKRDIFHDKLFLCLQIRSQSVYQSKNNDKLQKKMFLITRTSITDNILNYISYIGDQQATFYKTMDRGSSRHEFSIDRRKELGLYMDFLSDRAREILRKIGSLMVKISNITPPELNDTITLHRWDHSYTSKIKQTKTMDGKDILYINTSYWMPERPDLQPIIAHEVAHYYIKKYFDDLMPKGLANISYGDNFGYFFICLKDIFNKYRLDDAYITPLLKEIACDILAASVKGISFLYAMLLETLNIYHIKSIDMIDLHIMEDCKDVRIPTFNEYIRVAILLSWIKKIHEKKNAEINTTLFNAIDEIIDVINSYIDENEFTIPINSLINDIDQEVNHKDHRKLFRSIVKWRSNNKESNGSAFPKFAQRLNDEVREMLYELQLKSKVKGKNRALKSVISNKCIENTQGIDKEFKNIYGVNYNKKATESYRFPEHLYKYLYDIPWQTAVSRAIDVHECHIDNKTFNTLLAEIHGDFELGRGLFYFALEFHTHSNPLSFVKYASIFRLLEESSNEDIKQWRTDTYNEHKEQIKKISKKGMTQKSDINESLDYDKKFTQSLNKLLKIVNKLPNPKNHDKYAVLSFLSIYKQGGNKDRANFYKVIEKSMLFLVDDGNKVAPSYFKLNSRIVDRVTFSNIKKYEENITKNKNIPTSYLLGKYDTITIKETKYICRCPLPPLNDASFSIRREMASMINFSKDQLINTHYNNKPILAIISVVLQNRSYRLDFLYRLLQSITNNNSKYDTIENIGGYFVRGEDYGFMIDGWGDLLLIFTSVDDIPDVDRIDEINIIQNAIYQDFMVDRTELIYTLKAYDAVRNDERYNIEISVRLKEDRSLEYLNQQFIKNVKDNQNVLNIESLHSTPGDMDFLIKLNPEKNIKYASIIEKINLKLVDSMTTSIHKNIAIDGKL